MYSWSVVSNSETPWIVALLGSPAHGIWQARIPECMCHFLLQESSSPRDGTCNLLSLLHWQTDIVFPVIAFKHQVGGGGLAKEEGGRECEKQAPKETGFPSLGASPVSTLCQAAVGPAALVTLHLSVEVPSC